jgi:ATP-dependent protease HslVU (ClpYQ) peptidase subunit
MSIVAVKVNKDTIDIASDSIIVRGWSQSKSINKYAKLIEVNNMVIGSTGTAQESSLFWVFCATRRPEQATESSLITFFSEFSDWKHSKTDNAFLENEYILVIDKKVFTMHEFFIEEIVSYTAIGAGMDFAITSMYLGNNVQKAVEVACELSIFCELPVKSITINK